MRLAWQREPLRVRLVALFAGLLILAIAAVSALVLTSLRSALVSEVDAQLERAAQSLVWESTGSPQHYANPLIPSEYAVVIAGTDGTVVLQTTTTATQPVVGSLTLEAVRDRGPEPFTARSVEGGARWRVTVRTLDDTSGGLVGTAAIAMPLTSVDATMSSMVGAIMVVGSGVLLLAGAATYAVVRRSLRPLRRIEATAAQIAAGDLTRRVEDLPPTTEVGSLALSLNTMLTDLEVAFEARRQGEDRLQRFVGDASHELRTPLATVKGYTELYRLGGIPPQQVGEVMTRIEDSATRMADLVADLLALTRLDQGAPLSLSALPVRAVLEEAATDLGVLDPSREVTVIADDLPPILADAGVLRRIMTNLVGNAAAYSPAGSPVELVASVGGGGGAGGSGTGHPSPDAQPALVAIEVRDHGPGVPEADRERIFERFARLDAARSRDDGGSGLGLSIAQTAARALGGDLVCIPTPGGGATMLLTLPRA